MPRRRSFLSNAVLFWAACVVLGTFFWLHGDRQPYRQQPNQHFPAQGGSSNSNVGFIKPGDAAIPPSSAASAPSPHASGPGSQDQPGLSASHEPTAPGAGAGAGAGSSSAASPASPHRPTAAIADDGDEAAALSSPASKMPSPSLSRPAGPGATADASAPRIKLAQGTYVGRAQPSSAAYPKALAAFLGVPYAQSTGGQNRFRPPQPLGESNEVFGAAEMGQCCPGVNEPPEHITAGEDCLNANVYVPLHRLDAAGPRLPVVVYVHGGGFNTGLGAERNMASFVSWAEHDVVGVSFNYRVGPLGFLPSSLTAREGLLNIGLRDQQMLLRWVQDNIAAFGGDRGNVTVMGLSAGAHSIGHHMAHYASDPAPPFHKAILESGAPLARSVLLATHPRHLKQFREFLIAAGVEGAPEDEIMTSLRTLPLQKILTAAQTVWKSYQDGLCWPFQPVIDGLSGSSNSTDSSIYAATNATVGEGGKKTSTSSTKGGAGGSKTTNTTVGPSGSEQQHQHVGRSDGGEQETSLTPLIPDLPIKSLRRGKTLAIPVLMGYNANEGSIFANPEADTDAHFRSFFKGLLPSLVEVDMERLSTLYPDPTAAGIGYGGVSGSHPYAKVPLGMGRQWARIEASYGHYAYVCPVLGTAHFLSHLQRWGAPTIANRAEADGDIEAQEGIRKAAEGHSRVHVYRFAAVSAPWGTANHVDNQPFVSHDLAVLGGGTPPPPGLLAVSKAMHGAYVRFIASPDGDPNHVPTPATSSPQQHPPRTVPSPDNNNSTAKDSHDVVVAANPGSSSGSSSKALFHWPAFESPFANDRNMSRAAAENSGAPGRIAVFGEGNNERLVGNNGTRAAGSTANEGTPASAAILSEAELELCRFWWDRIELSQGLGKMLD